MFDNAEKMDRDPRALAKGFALLGQQGVLAKRIELPEQPYRLFVEEITSYSAALGFLQRQHQAASSIIHSGENETLKKQLPSMRSGQESSAASFAHLRNLKEHAVVAQRSSTGLLLSGRAAWVSGYRIFDNLVMGFFLPEENLEGFVYMPFKQSNTLQISEPLDLIAMRATQTVTVTLDAHPADQIITLKPIGTFASKAPLLARHFVSLAGVGLGLIRDFDLPHDKFDKIHQTFFAHDSEDYNSYAKMDLCVQSLLTEAKLKLGTKAILCPNAFERRYREYLLFSVITLNDKLKAASDALATT